MIILTVSEPAVPVNPPYTREPFSTVMEFLPPPRSIFPKIADSLVMVIESLAEPALKAVQVTAVVRNSVSMALIE